MPPQGTEVFSLRMSVRVLVFRLVVLCYAGLLLFPQ